MNSFRSPLLSNRSAPSAFGSLHSSKRYRERPKTINSGCKRLRAGQYRLVEVSDGMHIEVLWRIKFDFDFYVIPPQHDPTDGILRHHVHGKKRAFSAMNFEACRRMFNCESVMELRQ